MFDSLEAIKWVRGSTVSMVYTADSQKIKKFAMELGPLLTGVDCAQDFETKDYTLQFNGRELVITHDQYADDQWQVLIHRAIGVG